MTTGPTLDAPTRALLATVSVPTAVSLLYRKGLQNTLLAGPRPINPRAVRFVGTAFTVRTLPVREDLRDAMAAGTRPNLQAQSVARIAAGEVLVVAAAGETGTSFMGDIMTTHLMVKGVAGVVVDGAVSDAAAISEIDLPVFALANAAYPFTSRRMVDALNTPVECAGVAVFPGDVLLGDGNGVACIPAHLAAEIAEAGAERERLEAFVVEKVRGGAPLEGTYPPDEATLAAYRAWKEARGG